MPEASLSEIRVSDAISSLRENRLRILIVVPGLGPGGTERIVSLLASHWARLQWDVCVVSFGFADKSYYQFDSRVKMLHLALPSEGLPKHLFHRWWKLRSTIRRLRPNVVVSFLTRTNVIAILAALALPPPVIVSERNNPGLQRFGRIWEWLRDQTYPLAYGIVTMTKGAMDAFPPRSRRRSWIIPNPVALPRTWRNRRGQKILGAVGRLVHQKGFDLLIEAFSMVAPQHPAWTLVIWGDGPERIKLETLRAKLGLLDRIAFAGLSEEPGLWIETTDIFVLSSRFEGWGNVVSEAMAAGLPVVSFDCPFGPREMIEHEKSGILVEPGSVADLAREIDRLMHDEATRSRLGSAAALSARRFEPLSILPLWDRVVQEAACSSYRN
jgi:glycosyltransferase involved in cell wall biosynthesis